MSLIFGAVANIRKIYSGKALNCEIIFSNLAFDIQLLSAKYNASNIITHI